jgi:homocitrate synthase NifV
MPHLNLLDTTLRDGLQAPGVVLSRDEKVTLARAISDAGIMLLEVGIPAMGKESVDDIRAIADAIGPERIVTWCRANSADIQAAATTGVRHVHISFPVSDIHLGVWKRTQAWALQSLVELSAVARDAGFDSVSIGAQDASRANPRFLDDFAAVAASTHAARLRIADTVGVWSPRNTGETIRRLSPFSPPLEIHAHNDLGLATANTLTALEAGAAWADVTVTGLGERAGNAPLEEVVMAWRIAYRGEDSVHADHLTALSGMVSRLSGRPVPAGKPIIGSAVFTHETGIHCAGQMRDNRAYEPFAAHSVGREGSTFVIGEKTGVTALRAVLSTLGLNTDAARLLPRVRESSRLRRRALTLPELAALAVGEAA